MKEILKRVIWSFVGLLVVESFFILPLFATEYLPFREITQRMEQVEKRAKKEMNDSVWQEAEGVAADAISVAKELSALEMYQEAANTYARAIEFTFSVLGGQSNKLPLIYNHYADFLYSAQKYREALYSYLYTYEFPNYGERNFSEIASCYLAMGNANVAWYFIKLNLDSLAAIEDYDMRYAVLLELNRIDELYLNNQEFLVKESIDILKQRILDYTQININFNLENYEESLRLLQELSQTDIPAAKVVLRDIIRTVWSIEQFYKNRSIQGEDVSKDLERFYEIIWLSHELLGIKDNPYGASYPLQLMENKEYKKAITYFEKLIEYQPNFANDYLDDIANAYFELKKYNEAIAYYESFLDSVDKSAFRVAYYVEELNRMKTIYEKKNKKTELAKVEALLDTVLKVK